MSLHPQTSAASRRRRTGAALPLTLFVIVVLTMLSAGAFTMFGSERRVTDDHDAQLDAYTIARTGVERFIGSRGSLGFTVTPPAAVESTSIALPGGYAEVVMRMVRPPVDSTVPGLYVLRSRGVRTMGGLPNGALMAERTVAQYTRYQYASLEVMSAWTAMAGLLKSGTSGTLSGADGCGKKPMVAGVAVPNAPGYVQNGGGAPVPDGAPPILDMGNTTQTANAVEVDWAGIVNGYSIQPDIEFPGGTWPSASDWADPDFWPVIRVNGNFDLPTGGRGTIIVTGDMTIGGSRTWNGIVLVGGVLTSNGSNTVSGATISGLNIKLGIAVPPSDVGNGTKTFVYNSCDVESAVNAFVGLVPYRNASVDNWPAY